MRTLLLWDIDGTLIDSGGAGERGLIEGLQQEFGVVDDLRWLDWAGRTDRWIGRQILAHHGLPVDAAHEERLLQAYLRALQPALHNPRARVLPGIQTLIEQLAISRTFAQGLLTGNLAAGAALKLGHLGLAQYFLFGAYADDSDNRNELGPVALRRAEEQFYLPFSAERTIVIGDTPHDIACGKAIGAKTFAVATGKFSAADLAAHQPDFVFPDFQDTAAFYRAVEAVTPGALTYQT